MWRGSICVEGRKQRNGREDEKSMMIIVSYARYIPVPAISVAGPLHQQH